MQIDYYARYFAFENDDWWFVARRQIVLGLLGDALARRDSTVAGGPRRIVDDDRRAVTELFRVCRESGSAAITVPACYSRSPRRCSGGACWRSGSWHAWRWRARRRCFS